MRRMLLLGVILGAGAIVALAAATPSEAQDPSQRILTGLQSAAERGDRRAQAALDDLTAFAATRGFDLSKVAAESVADIGIVGRIYLRATGMAPFWINVFQDVRLDATYGIDNYVLERRAAAMALAGNKTYRGRLSMDGFAPLERLCELRDSADAVVDDADVDVWLGETWVTRFGFGPDRPDFWAGDCATVVDNIRSLLAQAHADDELGAGVAEARLTIHSAQLTVRKAGLTQLLRQDDVLLFDPEEDLLAAWSGRASHVRLVAPIDAFAVLIAARVDSGEIPEPFVPGALSQPKEVAP